MSVVASGRRRKVLMLTRLFPSRAFPTFGTFCAERARALAPHAEVRVMVPTPYFPAWLPGPAAWKQWARVERDGVFGEDIPVSYPRYVSPPGIATWLQGVAMAARVRREFAARHPGWVPDVIDAHFAFPDGYAALSLGRSLGVPVVVTCHGSDLRQYPDIPIAGAMTRRVLCEADRVVAVSSELLQASLRLGCPPERAQSLSNGVDPRKFALRDKASCRARLGLPLARKIGVCVANLVEVKGQSLLLQALAELRRQGGEAPLLVLVGDGPCRARLEREAEALEAAGDVMFVGRRAHYEVAVWMGAADWLLLSSHAEGWPTVYFEAMACGRPVITTAVSAARDAICRPEYGIVVEPRTPQAFAAAIAAASLSDYDEGFIRAHAEAHSWERWAETALDIFDQAGAGRAAGETNEG